MNETRNARTPRNAKNISAKRFRLWLESMVAFQNNPSVGLANDAARCPVAEYLRRTRRHNSVRVSPDTISYTTVRGTLRSYAPSPWVTEFVRAVDATRGDISAAKALELLDSVQVAK